MADKIFEKNKQICPKFDTRVFLEVADTYTVQIYCKNIFRIIQVVKSNFFDVDQINARITVPGRKAIIMA